MAELPSGTVTFLFTDVAGSTRLWEREPEAARSAMALHDGIIAEQIHVAGGTVVKTTGDGFHAVFANPGAAVIAARDAQLALAAASWVDLEPLLVRMAVHTGYAEQRDGDYYGTAVNRAARLMSVAHGGQILVSLATEELAADQLSIAGVGLRPLGALPLRDLSRPETVFQVVADGLESEFTALHVPGGQHGNLPAQLTPLVGRAADTAAVVKVLSTSRLVTLTGVGGVGKTRLALGTAAASGTQFGEGAWLVELASIDSPRVVEAIAAVLQVDVRGYLSVEQALLDQLGSRHLLLILDNCEHLVREARRVTEVLLDAAPLVSILVTSREPLHGGGEAVFSVPSLDPSAAQELFIERAQALDSTIVITDDQHAAIAQLCDRLEGIPLAIELAAARARMFNLDELARRLDERFRLLTGGRGDVERHHTLRAAVDWSFDLLDNAEQDVFVRLSVFADGATLEASEQVLVDDETGTDVLDVLTSLVDKSLVRVDRDRTPTRFGMLETIRQYAQERLVTRGDADPLRRRHAQYYASLARTIGRGLYSPEERTWDARLRDEIDDLQLAVSWATSAGETDWAMRIAGSFPRQGSQRPLLGTAHLAEQALNAPGADEHPLRARVLAEAAWAAIARGDQSTASQLLLQSIAAQRAGARYAAAAFTYFLRFVGNTKILVLADQADTVLPGVETPRQFIDEGLAMAAAANDTLGLAGLRSAAAILAFGESDYDTATALAEQALAEARTLRQPTLEISALLAMGMVRAQSDPLEAILLLRESVQLANDMGVEGDEQSSYGLLAELEARQGNLREALEALRQVARVARAVPYTNAGPVFYVGGRAFIDAGRPDLVAVCEAQGRWSMGNYFNAHDEIHARDIADAKALLGDDEFERQVREEENRPPELLADRMINEIDALLESM